MPRTRPKSFPSEEILSSGSSDSGLESDTLTVVLTIEADVEKSLKATHPDFQLGAEQPHRTRMNNLQNALDWVKSELVEMKLQDKQLAKTMIDLRSKIQQTKIDFESTANDYGYDSDDGDDAECDNAKAKVKTPTSILSYHFMGVNGDDFDQNKRATWAI